MSRVTQEDVRAASRAFCAAVDDLGAVVLTDHPSTASPPRPLTD